MMRNPRTLLDEEKRPVQVRDAIFDRHELGQIDISRVEQLSLF